VRPISLQWPSKGSTLAGRGSEQVEPETIQKKDAARRKLVFLEFVKTKLVLYNTK
jgi:hypothetical protein